MKIADYAVPVLVLVLVAYGIYKGCDVFSLFLKGAEKGIKTVFSIAPAMFGIMLALGIFKSSGALDLFKTAASPIVGLVGMPEDVVPLMLLRPISGSGALAVYKDIISACGPDSFAGRVASVMQGSTETTFYTIAVYYAATRVKNTRHTLRAALTGDAVGFAMSLMTVVLLFGRG